MGFFLLFVRKKSENQQEYPNKQIRSDNKINNMDHANPHQLNTNQYLKNGCYFDQ